MDPELAFLAALLKYSARVHIWVYGPTNGRHARLERDRYWPWLIKMYPLYRGYRTATDRVTPLVVCEPAWICPRISANSEVGCR